MNYFTLKIYPVTNEKEKDGRIKKDNNGDLLYVSTPISLSSEKKDSATISFDANSIVSATLVSLTYSKRVFHPCEIKAVLQIGYKQNVTTSKALKEKLVKAKVELSRTKGDTANQTEYFIAKNYYIHKIEPKYVGTVSIYVTLYIYSADNKLTMNKFCKAYTGRKLVEDVLLGINDDEKGQKTFSETLKSYGVSLANNMPTDANQRNGYLRYLSYSASTGNENNGKNSASTTTIREFRHPYLVQYNESLYEFVARTANRCGEYMFFENGMLYVGLPDSFTKSPLEIKKFTSLTFGSSFEGDEITVQPLGHNGMNQEGVSYLEKGKNAYVFATPQDEYFTSYEEDQWDSFTDEYIGDWGSRIFSAINTILMNKSIKDIVSAFTVSEALAVKDAYSSAKKTNSDNNTTYITKMPADQQCTLNNKKIASPFNSVSGTDSSDEKTKNFRSNLYSLFYSTIYAGEKYVTQNQIYIDFENEYAEVTLGQAISVDKETYIVTEIYGSLTNDNETYNEKARIVAVPIFPDPNNATDYIVLPPLYQGGHVRNSSPQIACIANTGDPESHGRVRIRYPWQNDEDDASPWIRMASPFAVEGGGMYFEPDEGTEVLVDYVNGNVEHPYVIGQLYSGNFTAPDGSRVISSANGQSITMKDADDASDFINNLWGGHELLTTLFPAIAKSEACIKDIAGEMILSDRYGIYSIKMSSAERKISISSNFGDVSIGAFTGISISAPNGDISISGKNVNITAGNSLTLKSGENIPDEATDMEKQLTKTESLYKKVGDSLMAIVDAETYTGLILDKVGSYIDLGLVRSILEAVIKPTAGTLQLKSYRYMTLEAGYGKAKLPRRAYTVKGMTQSTEEDHEENMELLENARLISEVVEKWDDGCRSAYNSVIDNRNSLKNALLTHTKPMSSGSNNNWTAEGIDNTIDSLVDKALKNPKQKISIDKNSIKVKFSADKTNMTIGFKTSKDENKENVKRVTKAAEALCVSVQTFVQKVKEPGKVIGFFKSVGDVNLRKAIKKMEMKLDCYSDVASGAEKFGEKCPSKEEVKNELKVFKRKLAKQYIEDEYLKITPEKSIAEADISDDDKWAEYIGSIVDKGKELVSSTDYWKKFKSDFASQMAEGLKDAVALPGFVASHDVWGVEKHGEILFSDKAGYTINFENGHLYQTRNDKDDDFYFDVFIDTLKSL